MATSGFINDADASEWETVLTPDTCTLSNSPTHDSRSLHEHAADGPTLRTQARPFPRTNTSRYSHDSPTPPKPKNPLSWFELRLLFCHLKTRDYISRYDPLVFRHGTLHKATVLFLVDREAEGKDECLNRLWTLIKEANPRFPSFGDDIDDCMTGFAVEKLQARGPSENVRVQLDAVVAQLWGMETEGLTAVRPDLFGMGTNELQVLLDLSWPTAWED